MGCKVIPMRSNVTSPEEVIMILVLRVVATIQLKTMDGDHKSPSLFMVLDNNPYTMALFIAYIGAIVLTVLVRNYRKHHIS